ncbi:Protein_disulfide isomerase PDI2 [Hexamita inflata]|uniref:Protein disulfide isomerase PDI2 n=1 Tax=Hexamita inflata TaxID=28002 RepID=A0AA86NZK7_9EUKA|nr:Protein disulfide isomerase PDI2 [Hexamita inflata]
MMLFDVILSVNIIKLDQDNKGEINSTYNSFIKFYIKECPACKTFNVSFYQLESLDVNATFFDVNCDTYPDVCQQFGVRQVPSLIQSIMGKPAGRLEYFASKDQIQKFVTLASANMISERNTFASIADARATSENQFIITAPSPDLVEAYLAYYRTTINISFVQSENISLFCQKKQVLIPFTQKISNPLQLRTFIHQMNRDWLVKITGKSIQRLSHQQNNQLSFIVLRESRDFQAVKDLEQFIYLMEMKLIKTDEETEKLFQMAKKFYQLAYIDTQEYMQYAEQFGIKKTFSAPVFVVQGDNSFSKQVYSPKINQNLSVKFNQNFTEYSQQLNVTENYTVPDIVTQFLHFLKADKAQKLEKLKYKEEKAKRVKIGKDQDYTPPAEGLFQKADYLLSEAMNESTELKVAVGTFAGILTATMILISWVFCKQNFV